MDDTQQLKLITARSELMLGAAKHGDHWAVKQLIPVCDPLTLHQALRVAAFSGYVQSMTLLSAVTDPKINESVALKWCAYNFHQEGTDFLIPLSDCNAVMKHFQKYTDGLKILAAIDFLQERMAVFENHTIHTQLNACGVSKRTKKI